MAASRKGLQVRICPRIASLLYGCYMVELKHFQAGASASGESPILTDDSSYRTVVELSATLFHHWFREARGDHRGVQTAGIQAVEDG